MTDIYTRFVVESNAIEGINRPPFPGEVAEMKRFMALRDVTVDDLKQFVSVYQPNAVLRSAAGLDVYVGDHIPPAGGPEVMIKLTDLLQKINQLEIDPYEAHVAYETLHPFTDGNGRSGRMLWAWMMKSFDLGFLHTFYYQALSHAEERAATSIRT